MEEIEMETEKEGWAHFVLCTVYLLLVNYLIMLFAAQTLLLNIRIITG